MEALTIYGLVVALALLFANLILPDGFELAPPDRISPIQFCSVPK